MSETKRCCHCHEELPLEAFGKCKTNKDGLKRDCIKCRRNSEIRRHAKFLEDHKDVNILKLTKECSRCGKALPLSEFFGCSTSTDGHSSECKKCALARTKRTRAANTERNSTLTISETKYKECSVCHRLLPASSFHLCRSNSDGLYPMCKECKAKSVMEHVYGITQEEFDAMLKKQGNACNICHEVFTCVDQWHKPYVDHDHKTGAVRGLLCQSCNHSLGGFKDSEEILGNAIKHLREAREAAEKLESSSVATPKPQGIMS